MPLEDMLKLVETLKARIATHSGALSNSESDTRYALINPLLKELGWDTSDPAQVRTEYAIGGRADYALFGDDSNIPIVIVEAKKMSVQLEQEAVQALNYCNAEGVPYFAVTNGKRWEVYDTFKPVPLDKKKIVSFDLLEQPPVEVCLKALALWREGILSSIVMPANSPLTAYPNEDISPTLIADNRVQSQIYQSPTPFVSEPADVSFNGWHTLNDFRVISGGPSPRRIRFPDGSQTNIARWKSILIETVRWLVNRGLLNLGDCPIRKGNNKRYMVSTSPIHPSDNPFRSPEAVGQFHIETHINSIQSVRNTKFVIERVGQNPADFFLKNSG